MNIFLWILQVLLALHTLTGAIWKFTNSEQTIPSLAALPHGIWLSLSILEIICSLFLLLPAFKKSFGFLIPIASAFIAAEMILFTVVHLNSQEADPSPMIYWLVVAALCAFISYARLKIKPVK